MFRALKITVSLTAFLLISIAAFSQKSELPNTLLWRVSGKGITKPSYIFGTMHIKDKRVFDLGDSLFAAMEKTEGFALEVNFADYMDSMMHRMIAKQEQEFLNDDEEIDFDLAKVDKSVDTVLKEFKVEKKLTRKQLKRIREYRMRQITRGEMPTILDAYLFGIAQRQGKWTGAVEDVVDQLDLVDEIGSNIKPEDIFVSEKELRNTLEDMIEMYLNQEINALYEGSRRADSKEGIIIFNRRNMKMVKSIDSLSRLRSMFYAVGAAHLAGDSGVIHLLRAKGYTVEPVFSKAKMPAEKYLSTLQSIPWQNVNTELYTVKMPGTPGDFNIMGELVKMKMYFDFMDMSVYMSGYAISNISSQAELNETIDEIGDNINEGSGSIKNKKVLSLPGALGVEGVVEDAGLFFKIRLVHKGASLFLMMVGSENSAKQVSANAEKFFTSFNPKDIGTGVDISNWEEFTLADKAFSVRMPGKPKRNKALEDNGEESNGTSIAYDYSDAISGLYYLLQVRDLAPGFFFEDDSTYFESFRNIIIADVSKVERNEITKYQGYPALFLSGHSMEEKANYKTLTVIRGNRIYTLMVVEAMEGHAEKGDFYLNSLRMLDYSKVDWRTNRIDGMLAWTPARIEKVVKKDELTGEVDSTEINYRSHNPKEAVSYDIFKAKEERFYWVKDDSTYYDKLIQSNIGFGDSLLSVKDVQNGKLKGKEITIQAGKSNNLQRTRYFLNGDTLYTLISYLTTQDIGNENNNKFFNDFRVLNEDLKPTIFTKKITELMNALSSSDSATFEEAKAALEYITFEKQDLPLLHNAFLKSFLDDSLTWNSASIKLENIIANIQDSQTVDFIKKNYPELAGKNENRRMQMINILTKIPTSYSYTAIKDLIKDPPKGELNFSLSYYTSDSLELTKILYPDIIRLIDHPSFWGQVTYLTRQMIDSGHVSIEDIRWKEEALIQIGDTSLRNMMEVHASYVYMIEDVVYLLGKLNSVNTNALLKKMTTSKNLDVKQMAVLELLKNDQPVSKDDLLLLAADPATRADFYEKLEKEKLEKHFPAKYLSQRFLGESELFINGDDDYSPSKIEFLEERTAMFDGKKQKFYLFKVDYNYEDEYKSTFLGVAGPYDIDSKNLKSTHFVTGILSEEEFDRKKISTHFSKHLEEMEDYLQSVNANK